MKLTFIYTPTSDLGKSAQFYSQTLGLNERWREGDDTIAFALPDSDVQLMVSTSPGAPGPMYLVPSVAEGIRAHPTIEIVAPAEDIPGGAVAELLDPSGTSFYVFDQ